MFGGGRFNRFGFSFGLLLEEKNHAFCLSRLFAEFAAAGFEVAGFGEEAGAGLGELFEGWSHCVMRG